MRTHSIQKEYKSNRIRLPWHFIVVSIYRQILQKWKTHKAISTYYGFLLLSLSLSLFYCFEYTFGTKWNSFSRIRKSYKESWQFVGLRAPLIAFGTGFTSFSRIYFYKGNSNSFFLFTSTEGNRWIVLPKRRAEQKKCPQILLRVLSDTKHRFNFDLRNSKKKINTAPCAAFKSIQPNTLDKCRHCVDIHNA